MAVNRRGIVVLKYRSVSPFVEIGPPPQASVASPLGPKCGGRHTCFRGEGGRDDPIPTKGQKLWYCGGGGGERRFLFYLFIKAKQGDGMLFAKFVISSLGSNPDFS